MNREPFHAHLVPEILRRFWALIDDGFEPRQLAVTVYETEHPVSEPGPIVDVVLREQILLVMFAQEVDGSHANAARVADRCNELLSDEDPNRVPILYLCAAGAPNAPRRLEAVHAEALHIHRDAIAWAAPR